MDWLSLPLLFGVGVVAGMVNVVAGGGSFLTLPALIFLGLPAGVANGTNRVALLLQNVGAVSGFARHGVVDWSFARCVVPSAVVGAALGAWSATMIGDLAFRRLLALLMLVTALWTVLDPLDLWGRGTRGSIVLSRSALRGVFFAIGVYGGFIAAGVGFLLLVGTTLGGLDLVRGNAVKVLSVLAWTLVTVMVFASAGMIHWQYGLAMGLGNLAGSQLGVRWTVLKGNRWVRAFITVTILVFAFGLWFFG